VENPNGCQRSIATEITRLAITGYIAATARCKGLSNREGNELVNIGKENRTPSRVQIATSVDAPNANGVQETPRVEGKNERTLGSLMINQSVQRLPRDFEFSIQIRF